MTEFKYILKENFWGVTVYCNGTITALIENNNIVVTSNGYSNALEYCTTTFLS